MTRTNGAGLVVGLGGAALLVSWGGWPVVLVLVAAVAVAALDLLCWHFDGGGRAWPSINADGALVNVHAEKITSGEVAALPSPAEDRGQRRTAA